MQIDLFLTPIPLKRAELENRTVVVVDVLRSTTSICTALVAGARGVIPTSGPGEAAEMWNKIGSDSAVLAGEREGVRIDNFNLGNSPAEFTREAVRDKYVVMNTTNGTAIFQHVRKAACVFTCALVNISRVAERVARENRDTVIVCSGQAGDFSVEDTLCGGMLIDKLRVEHSWQAALNDAASLALLLYESGRTTIRQTIERSEHGRFLESIGFGGDVDMAARVDSVPVLPVMRDGRLILENN